MIVHTDEYAGLDYTITIGKDWFKATLGLNGVTLCEDIHYCVADDIELAALEYEYDLPGLLEEAEGNMLAIAKHYMSTL